MKRHDNELLIKATANSKGLTLVDREAHAANMGFASGGVTCKLGALCFYSSSVLVDSFVLRNPLEHKALNLSQSSICREIGNANKFHQTPFAVFC